MTLVMNDQDGKVISAVAEGNISGGDWLTPGSYTALVDSLDESEFAAGRVRVARGGSGTNAIGLALRSVQSGTDNNIAVARCGVFILPCAGAVTAGTKISPAGNGNGAGAVAATADGEEEANCGTALTAAASGGFAICAIRL